MERNRAIPEGYMTVGELAKKMDVTVRTLQYYDKSGLLSPSAESEGGRRLYTQRDLVKLHQILSLKHLGFSLDDIRVRMTSLDTPADVADALAEQADEVERKIAALSEALEDIRALREEVVQMQSVDFQRYADIIVNLQIKNEFYWMIKYFDQSMIDYLHKRFDKKSAMLFIDRFKRLSDEILKLRREGAPPDGEKGQRAADSFWKLIMDFTGGDMSMMPKLMNMGCLQDAADEQSQKRAKKQMLVNEYIGKALETYFTNLGINPFGEDAK